MHQQRLNELYRRGIELSRREKYDQSVKIFRKLQRHAPDKPDLLMNLAAAELWVGQTEAGLANARRAVKLKPDDPEMWRNYAVLLHRTGRAEETMRVVRRALELAPEDRRLLYLYCNFGEGDDLAADNPVIRRCHRLLEEETMPDEERSFLLFGLSRALDKQKEHESAMEYAIAGGRHYGVRCRITRERTRNIVLANTAEVLRREPCGGLADTEPCFILGMPRSGTTFTEQVLSRHPRIAACGELNGGRMAERVAIAWAQQTVGLAQPEMAVCCLLSAVEETAAENHLETARAVGGPLDGKVWTDKLPENVFRLGLLCRLFPNARVIVTRRHPLDNCASCLMQRFVDPTYSYSNDPAALAEQYLAQEMILEHWKQVLPNPILEITYEEMVDDFERHVRAMLDFLGLDWDPACLHPEENRRMVATASAAQIRQGVNRGSVGRWRRYEHALQPLIEAFGGLDAVDRMVDARESLAVTCNGAAMPPPAAAAVQRGISAQ